MDTTRSCWVALALVGLLLSTTACEDLAPEPEEQEAVEAAVRTYLDSLAAAYSSLDVTVMTEHATGAEIVSVQEVIRTLVSSGDRIDASLLSVEVENLMIFRGVNATARTLEVWEVIRYDAFTGEEKARNQASIQKGLIQLRLRDGRWMVTGRRVLDRQGESRWTVTTPTPDPGAEP
jgi:hypothetical protein